MVFKEVYVQTVALPIITAGTYYSIDLQKEARKSDYLPFNKLRIYNKSAQEIAIYLDGVDMSKTTTPDYIIPAGTGMEEDIIQGVNYNMLTIKNNGAVDTVADLIVVRMATARDS